MCSLAMFVNVRFSVRFLELSYGYNSLSFSYPLKMTNKNNLQELTKSLFCIKQLKTFRVPLLSFQEFCCLICLI